jgi:hypothetical protein
VMPRSDKSRASRFGCRVDGLKRVSCSESNLRSRVRSAHYLPLLRVHFRPIAPRWTPQIRPLIDTQTRPPDRRAATGLACGGDRGVGRRLEFGPPATRAASEDVRVVEESVEQRGHGGGVAEQFAPVVDRPVGRQDR